MTQERMMEILKDAHKALGENPSREALHAYNELARQLRSEMEHEQAQREPEEA